MLLVTGATGFIGSSLLPRLTEEGTPVRCLVRDPRRLGAERVRVQISLGELTDHRALRNAVRGVRTVIHLGAGAGDQPRATLQELGSIATWRLVEAAERAGVERMLFFTPLGAGLGAPTPLLRDKALGTNMHRHGGWGNDVAEEICAAYSSGSVERIVGIIGNACSVFDRLATDLCPGYSSRLANVSAALEEARQSAKRGNDALQEKGEPSAAGDADKPRA